MHLTMCRVRRQTLTQLIKSEKNENWMLHDGVRLAYDNSEDESGNIEMIKFTGLS